LNNVEKIEQLFPNLEWDYKLLGRGAQFVIFDKSMIILYEDGIINIHKNKYSKADKALSFEEAKTLIKKSIMMENFK